MSPKKDWWLKLTMARHWKSLHYYQHVNKMVEVMKERENDKLH